MTKLDPIGGWLKEGVTYVRDNLLMLVGVIGWSMLMYLGAMAAMGLGIVASVFLIHYSQIGWDVGTGILAVIAGLGGFIVLFAVAGKMMLMQILAAKEPVVGAKALWRKLTIREGLAFYWLLLLIMFAFYGAFMLLIIPGIMVMVWVSLAMNIKVDRGVGALYAMMLSRDYTKGYFWAILGRWLLAMILLMSVVGVAMIIYFQMSEIGGVLGVVGYLFYLVVSILTGSVMYRLSWQLYRNLVKIKGKIEIKPSKWRVVRWSLLAYSPLVLAVVATALLIAINPAKQIEKSKQFSQQQSEYMQQ